MNKNIFQSVLDGMIYVVLYLVIPVAQIIAHMIVDPSLVWFSSLLATSSLAYDSYTRFSYKSCGAKKRKIVTIGVVSFLLMLWSIAILMARANGVATNIFLFWPYLLLVVPLFIAVIDTIEIFANTVNSGGG